MNHRTLTLAAAIISAGLIGVGSPLAANAMDRDMHHHGMDFHRHHHHHYSCDYRLGHYRSFGYRHSCRPMDERHMGYGYMRY